MELYSVTRLNASKSLNLDQIVTFCPASTTKFDEWPWKQYDTYCAPQRFVLDFNNSAHVALEIERMICKKGQFI